MIGRNKISFIVSEENIDDGYPHNACLCPISVALQEKFRLKPEKIYVSPITIIFFKNKEYWYKLNKEGRQFLFDYDGGKPVRQTSVEAELVKVYAI